MTVKVYQGCSWFNKEQTQHMNNVFAALKENPTVDYKHSFRPLDDQFNDIDISKEPEFLNNFYQSLSWGNETYKSDINGIHCSDLGVFAYHPDYPDDGQAFELGYFNACHKPAIVVVPDGYLQKFKDNKSSLNLMIAYGSTQVVTVSQLKEIDLNKVINKPFFGNML